MSSFSTLRAGTRHSAKLRIEQLEDRHLLSIIPGFSGIGMVTSTSDVYYLEVDFAAETLTPYHLGKLTDGAGNVVAPARDDAVLPGFPGGDFLCVRDDPSGPAGAPSMLRQTNIDVFQLDAEPETKLVVDEMVALWMTNTTGVGPETFDVRINALEWTPNLGGTTAVLFGAGYAVTPLSAPQDRYDLLFTINTATGEATPVVDLETMGLQSAGDIAFDLDGKLYLSCAGDKILEVGNLSSATPTTVVHTLTHDGDDFDALLPYSSGSLIGITQNRQYYEINLASNTTTLGGTLTHPDHLDAGELVYGATVALQEPEDLGTISDEVTRTGVVPGLQQKWYQMDVAADGALTVEMTGGTNADTIMILYEQVDGGELDPVGYYDSSSPGTPWQIAYDSAHADGGSDYTYYLHAINIEDPSAFRFTLSSGGGAILFGAVGDSLTDEYANEGYSYAQNWLESLVQTNRVDAGIWGYWTEPRRAGYQTNWARTGATTASMLESGQHTGLAGQVDAGLVDYAVMAIGQNDFSPSFSGAYAPIYNGFWTADQIDEYCEQIVANFNEALATIGETDVNLVMSNIIDYGVAPTVRTTFPDAVKRERVTTVIRDVNNRIEQLAHDYGVPVADSFGLSKEYLGENSAPVASQWVGGVEFTNTGGNDAHNGFVTDGIHPHTVLSAMFGNLFMEALNQGFSTNLELFGDLDILTLAGLEGEYDAGGPTLNVDFSQYVSLPSSGSNSVGNLVWEDLNQNGLQDFGEPGLAGVEVQLYTAGFDGLQGGADDVLVDTVLTDAAGGFRFDNLPDNDYYLTFIPPSEYGLTINDAGGDDTVDSDPDPATWSTDVFTLAGDVYDDTRDAGMVSGFPASPVDLGTIDYVERDSETPHEGQLLYRFRALRDGMVSAAVGNYTGSPTLALHNADGRLLAVTEAGEQLDFPSARADEQFYLSITGLTSPADVTVGNLVRVDDLGVQVTAFGTAGADTVDMGVDGVASLQINRLRYESVEVYRVDFDGLGGTDSAHLDTSIDYTEVSFVGSEATVVVPVWASGAALTVNLQNTESFDCDANGAGDTLWIGNATASAAERLTLRAGQADWQAGTLRRTVRGVETVEAYAGGGGNDFVEFRDSDGDDTFVVGPANPTGYQADMQGTTSGGMAFRNSAEGFSKVDALASAGGSDTIDLYTAAGSNDKVSVTTAYCSMVLPGSYNVRGFGFENVSARTSAGETDTVGIWTAGGDDSLTVDPDRVQLTVGDPTGEDVPLESVDLRGFSSVTVRSGEGTDTANLSDGGTGTADMFMNRAAGGVACFRSADYTFWMVGFEQFDVTASDASDKAYLLGHDGAETFTYYADPGNPAEKTQLAGTAPDGRQTSATVAGFGSVYAYAGSGGQDVAQIHDSPASADRYWAGPTWAVVQGTGFLARAAGFDAYEGYLSGGGSGDTATLYGSSATADRLESYADHSQITYAGDANRYSYAEGYRWLKSFAGGAPAGVDEAILYLPAGSNDEVRASFANPQLTARGSGYYVYVKQFGRAEIHGNAADNDTATTWDSAGDEHLAADGATQSNLATISNTSFTLELWDLSYIHAIANQGGDDTRDVQNEGLLDFVLESTGTWRDV